MKKLILLALVILFTMGFISLRLNKTPGPTGPNLDKNSENLISSHGDSFASSPESRPSIALKEQNSDPDKLASAHRSGVLSQNQVSGDSIQKSDVRKDVASAAGVSLQAPLKLLDVTGPSIGTIKVIGSRGCDTNTQGWYLGKGKPDEYDYTESDDGESLVVQPNVQNLTGAFEFVHCVDANEIAGKHIQFRVRLKAQDVKDVAQLRFWGENLSRERILFKSEKVIGTYDWKDFALEADVPSEVTLFNYGITFKNSGKLWVSHPVFGVSPVSTRESL